MGNVRSAPENGDETADTWWNNTIVSNSSDDCIEDPEEESRSDRRSRMNKELDEFKIELAQQHEKRRKLIADKRQEMDNLRRQVEDLKRENVVLKSAVSDDGDDCDHNRKLKTTIAEMQLEIQNLNAQVVDFEKERLDYKNHVRALKDVISVSKQMLLIRETQLKELRDKVHEIERTLAPGQELSTLSQNLKREYEKQLENIRNLRHFYDERQKADQREKTELKKQLDEKKIEVTSTEAKMTEMQETIDRLELDNSAKYDEIKTLESNLGLAKAEGRQHESELMAINQLFSHILVDFDGGGGGGGGEFDKLDRLISLLEQNHNLLQDIAINEDSNQVSALPKILLDLVQQLNSSEVKEGDTVSDLNEEQPSTGTKLNSATHIAQNLPKVWKVLIELLSHHQNNAGEVAVETDTNPCYNVIQTAKGPDLVLSVSKTFIRLKDLILEKKSLERETNHLKHLNTHLECRLQEQERRLELVTHELSDTWHVVGKLQKKHQLLHTQEKILRYELAQKRKLLTQLREQLEESRDKWQQARLKNSDTEKQWEELRSEFKSRRRLAGGADDANNSSVESGYSDDKESSEDDEDKGVLDARERRLASLEEQCGDLVEKVGETSDKSHAIEDRLDRLHEVYGPGTGTGTEVEHTDRATTSIEEENVTEAED